MVNEVSAIKAGSAPTGGGYSRIPLAEIHESKPGRIPDPALRESIKQFGVLQPVLVARKEQGFELLAGSRRLHASRDAGLADIPAMIITPDRAGPLDVFLEENLSRQELSELERIRLRNQWMRETGRDEDQARKRIPEPSTYVDEALTPEKPWFAPHLWKIISALLGVLCIALFTTLIMGTSETDDVLASDEMDIEATLPATTEVIEAAPLTDVGWMDPFRFPRSARIVEGETLTLLYARPLFSPASAELTPTGRVFLNQLAAICLSADQNIRIEVSGYGADATPGQSPFELGLERAKAAAALLNGEGIDESRIVLLGATRLPDEVGYEQTVKITLRR